VSLPFLLEIGCEEIPDWMIVPALGHLRDLFTALISEHKLGGAVTWVDATPRRLVLRADGLVERQADTEELMMGPPKSAGAGAASGFAKKMGATTDALLVESTPKGEYFAFRKKVAGRATSEILKAEIEPLIYKIPWPKTMFLTGKGSPRWIRPIRWTLMLLGSESGVTYGHRRLSKGPIEVTIESYEQRLRENFVIVRSGERRERILDEINKLGYVVRRDDKLLETLVYLTEWPTPIAGRFDPTFLDLPEEVLVTVMRHHQKYFSVEGPNRTLAPAFVTVMNTSGDPEGLVRLGNERVLRARFNDARFFWNFDQQKKLVDRVEDLKHVTFHAKLGSYFEKTERIVALVKDLGGNEHAQRAALLSKCDLTTEMVKEFTDLQGVVGGRYAQAQGEPHSVWLAIYDHYKPTSMEDSIPSNRAGQLLSLADKLDTLREFFRIGLMPSGSKDPFALRRAAQGVVKILVESDIEFQLTEFPEFFEDRVRFYFKEMRGFPYDEVNAAMAAGWSDLRDLESRLNRIHAIRPTPDFEPLAASFKRIKNILRQANHADGKPPDIALLESGPEKDLFDAFSGVRGKPIEQAIGALRPKVDLFFDKVLVNAQDPRIRENRLNLLSTVLQEFSKIADFSEIVTQQEKQ
jgi:glycyl-tRNA synthetase beta chain